MENMDYNILHCGNTFTMSVTCGMIQVTMLLGKAEDFLYYLVANYPRILVVG